MPVRDKRASTFNLFPFNYFFAASLGTSDVQAMAIYFYHPQLAPICAWNTVGESL